MKIGTNLNRQFPFSRFATADFESVTSVVIVRDVNGAIQHLFSMSKRRRQRMIAIRQQFVAKLISQLNQNRQVGVCLTAGKTRTRSRAL